MTYNKQKALFTFWVVLYVLVIHFSYISIISPSFAYMGYTKNPSVNMDSIFIMVFMILIPAAFVRLSGGRVSNFIILLFYIIIYIPTQYIATFIDYRFDNLLFLRFYLLLSLGILVFLSKTSKRIVFSINLSQNFFRVIIFTIFALLMAVVVSEFGFSIQVLSIFDVYDVRSEYKIDTADAGKLLAYSVPYLGVISSFMLGYGYLYRFTPFIFLGAISLLYIFGFTGQKSTLFSILLVLGLIFLYRRDSARFGVRMIAYSTTLASLSFAFDTLFNQPIATSIFTRRVLMTPGLLTLYYFDFFSVNQPVMLSHSFLSSISAYPYDIKPPLLIGREYFNSSSMNANANFLADGYSNFRAIGMFSFSLILGFILRFIDLYSNPLKHKTVIACGLALPIFSLTNSALFTSFLTHGLAFSIILTIIYAMSQQEH